MKSVVASAVLASMPWPAHAIVYWADEIHGRVVEAETARPVEGALVIANWQLESGLDTGIPKGQMQILETTTDHSGVFRLPSWGPKISLTGHASFKWPQILIFKPGFRYQRLVNQPHTGSERATKSDWHGKTIALLAASDAAAYRRDFSKLNQEIDWIGVRSGDECAWRKLQQTLRALGRETERLQSMGATDFYSFVGELKSGEQYFAKKGCGSVAEFLAGSRK